MKICFISDQLTGIGGLQRVVINVINNLAMHSDNEIFLIYSHVDRTPVITEYPLNDKVHIIEDSSLLINKYSYPVEKVFRKIHRKFLLGKNGSIIKKIYFPKREIKAYDKFIMDNSIDIVVGVAPRPSALVSMLTDNVRKIGWFHNTFERYFNIQGEYEFGFYDLYKELLKNLDKLIVLTNHDQVVYHDKFNIDTQRIYNPLSFKIKEKANLINNNVLFIGRLQYSTKGLDLLADIIKKVTILNENVTFMIVGENVANGKEKLIQSLKNNNVEKAVKFKHSTSDVIPFYLNSSITVLPSRIEGFGLIVTESLEAGVPVISFKTEGPSEIIENGENGILIEKFDTENFANEINNLLLNKEKLREMGQNAKIRAESFSMETIINEWLELFQDLN